MNRILKRSARGCPGVEVVAVALAISLAVASGPVRAASSEDPRLPRSTPEAEGVASTGILTFLAAVEATHPDALNSFMLVRHGRVVAAGWWAPYDAAIPHALYSGTKSFTSLAVGLALNESRLQLDDHVLDYFPDQRPDVPEENLRAMRIRDLLTMSTGQEVEPPFRGNPEFVRTFLHAPVPSAPGTRFLYNTAATDMAGIIIEKVTGKSLRDYLQPRLFDPLGVTNLRWTTLPEGFQDAGIGLSIRTEDLACFGQLLLQHGRWRDRAIVPASWVEAATSRQVSSGTDPASDAAQGYGFQFWRCRHNAYRADGAFGQFCIVMPDQDAVVVITSGIMNDQMQSMLNLVWEHLLPALWPAPLPEDPAHATQLVQALAIAAHRLVPGAGRSALSDTFRGRTYACNANDLGLTSIRLDACTEDAIMLAMRFRDGPEQQVACSRTSWRKGRIAFSVFPDQPAAASAAWSADDVLVSKLIFYENPFAMTLRLQFSGDTIAIEPRWNLGFGGTQLPAISGRARVSRGDGG